MIYYFTRRLLDTFILENFSFFGAGEVQKSSIDLFRHYFQDYFRAQGGLIYRL